MPPRNRSIRLFVSSTFSDMHEERDALCRFVFPFLEDFCDRRNVGFTGIDLRWGVTDDEVRQGKTIELCLSEIENCRPYFLGILGERYGWVPEKELTTGYRSLFRHDNSITEAEMNYGALSTSNNAWTKAFFCLRSFQLSNQIAGETQDVAKSSKRLTSLKKKIRKSPYPVLDGYTSISDFCDFIKEQLCKAIEADFPIDETLDEYRSESITHTRYAQQQSDIFSGREKELSDIDRQLQTNAHVPLFVTGAPGTGKTAFLARWAIRRQESEKEDFVFMHFFGASIHSDRWENLARRLIYELCQTFNLPFKLPDTAGELTTALSDCLYIASQKGKKILLVFDGIDLVNTDKSFGMAWLPKVLPQGVWMLLSVKTPEGRENLRQRNFTEYRLRLLNRTEQKALITSHLKPYSKKLEPHQVEKMLKSKSAKNPLYLKVLLNELCTRSTHDRMDSLLDWYLQAFDIQELFSKVIEMYEQTYHTPGKNITHDALTLVCCSKHGLTESELLSLLDVPRVSFSPLYLAMRPYLINKNGILSYAFSALNDAVKKCYIITDDIQKSIRLRLATYFADKTNAHAMEELPWLLEKTGSWEKLYDVLGNPGSFHFLWKYNPSEVKRYWTEIESNTTLNRLDAYKPSKRQFRQTSKQTLLELAAFLFETGYSLEAEHYLSYLCKIRPTSVHRHVRQQSFGMLGNLYFTTGQYKEANMCYRKKIRLCKKEGDTLELSRVWGNLGLMAYSAGNFEEALNFYRQAGQTCRQLGFMHGIQADLGNRGNIYLKMNELEEAASLFKEQEQFCRECEHIPGLIAALGNRGIVSIKQGKYEEALHLFEQQQAICLKIGDTHQLQLVLGNMAVALYQLGKKLNAIRLLKEKLVVCEKINNFDGKQMALANLVDFYANMGEKYRTKAMDLCHERIEFCRKHKARVPLAQSLYQYAQLLMACERRDEAEAVMREVQILV